MSHRFKSAYGIDASDRRAVVVRALGRGSFETLCTSNSANVPESLRRMIADDVANGRAASAAALACHESVLRRVSSPFARLDRARKVLPSLLDVQLPFPLEQCAYVFTGAAPNATGGLDALAIAARREDVQHALQRLGESGIDPVFLDHEGLALWRQAQREIKLSGDAGRVLVHLGPSHTTLVYGRGPNLLGAHSTRSSGTETAPAELAARIQSWLRSQTALAVTPQTEWIFSGAGAADSKRISDLSAQFNVTASQTVDDPAAFLARALAARALEGDDFSCNLRTDVLQHAQARRISSSGARRLQIAALAAALLLCAVNIGTLFFLSKRNDGAQAEIQKLASELSGAPAPKGQEVLVVQRALDEKSTATKPFQNMIVPLGSRRLAEMLSLCRTNGAAISHIVLQPDALKITMTAANSGAADRIATALRFGGWQIQTQHRDTDFLIEGKR